MIEQSSDPVTLLEALLTQKLVRGNQSLARDLSQLVELRAVEAGQVLIQQGGDDNDLYFLLAGRYEIVVNGRKIATRGSGEHVGEMAAILPSLRRLFKEIGPFN